jgi:HEAT repeat protein
MEEPEMDERTTMMESRATELVDAFAGSRWWEALQELSALGTAALPAVKAGLLHGNWRVRRGCVVYFDHVAGLEALELVIPLLHDPKSDVRRWAVHALACDRCKAGENPLDVEPYLVERALHDESLNVRRHAVISLAYLRPPDPRGVQVFEHVLARETDRRIRMHAEVGLRKAVAAGLRTDSAERETG